MQIFKYKHIDVITGSGLYGLFKVNVNSCERFCIKFNGNQQPKPLGCTSSKRFLLVQGETGKIMCSSSLPLDKALSEAHTTSVPNDFSHILPRFTQREVQ